MCECGLRYPDQGKQPFFIPKSCDLLFSKFFLNFRRSRKNVVVFLTSSQHTVQAALARVMSQRCRVLSLLQLKFTATNVTRNVKLHITKYIPHASRSPTGTPLHPLAIKTQMIDFRKFMRKKIIIIILIVKVCGYSFKNLQLENIIRTITKEYEYVYSSLIG